MKWHLNVLPKEACTAVFASGLSQHSWLLSAQVGRAWALKLIQPSQTPAAASSQQAKECGCSAGLRSTQMCAISSVDTGWGWPVKRDCHS